MILFSVCRVLCHRLWFNDFSKYVVADVPSARDLLWLCDFSKCVVADVPSARDLL